MIPVCLLFHASVVVRIYHIFDVHTLVLFLVKCLPKKRLLQGSSFLYFINFNRENRTKIELINVIRSSSLNKFDFVMEINEKNMLLDRGIGTGNSILMRSEFNEQAQESSFP